LFILIKVKSVVITSIMQNSRMSNTPRPTPTLTNSILKNPLNPNARKPKFFKKLFAALKAVTRTAEKGGTC
jgi:hypothetical protein